MAIYLHYLDRELGRSLDVSLSPDLLKEVTDVLLVGAGERLYCGLSLLWEQPAAQKQWSYVANLLAAQQLVPLSSYPTAAEFLEAKQQEYAHDEVRYPVYFDSDLSERVRLQPFEQAQSSTTLLLVAELRQWATHLQGCDTSGDRIGSAALQALDQREGKAVTLSLFAPVLADPSANRLISREISRGYTSHYLALLKGDLPTGVAGLTFYDSLAQRFPLHDVSLLKKVLMHMRAPAVLPDTLTELVALRGQDLHVAFVSGVRNLLVTATPATGTQLERRFAGHERIAEAFADPSVRVRQRSRSWRDFFEQGLVVTAAASDAVGRRYGVGAGTRKPYDQVGAMRVEYLEMLKRLPSEVVRIVGGSENVGEFLLDELLAVCDDLVVRASSLVSLQDENKINDLSVSLLNSRLAHLSWHAKDQSRGGESATGKSGAHSGVGERDWVVSDSDGRELAIFEAFILDSIKTRTIEVHNLKIFKYDPAGRPADFILIYATTSDVENVWGGYLAKVRSAPFPDDAKMLSGPDDISGMWARGAAFRVACAVHSRHERPVRLYHVCVALGAR